MDYVTLGAVNRKTPARERWGVTSGRFWLRKSWPVGPVPFMIQHTMVRYRVKPDGIDQVKEAIRVFVAAVRADRENTIFYEAYQETTDVTNFVHFMKFRDEAADEAHRRAEHTRAFVAVLYPLCESAPAFYTLSAVDTE